MTMRLSRTIPWWLKNSNCRLAQVIADISAHSSLLRLAWLKNKIRTNRLPPTFSR